MTAVAAADAGGGMMRVIPCSRNRSLTNRASTKQSVRIVCRNSARDDCNDVEVSVEHHQVGVGAGLEPPLRCRSHSVGRGSGRRLNGVYERPTDSYQRARCAIHGEHAAGQCRTAGKGRAAVPDLDRQLAQAVRAVNDDVVRLLGDFIERIAQKSVLLLGHSYGAYLARGLAAQRPDLVLGLALSCPVGDSSGNVPGQEVVRQDADAYDELEAGQRQGFDEYFVVRTRATAHRYRDHVVPGTALVDEAALGRIFAGWTVDVGSENFSAPTLIVAGRRDSTVGSSNATQLLEPYPHATLAVIESAGHALMHERAELLAALLGDWLARTRPDDK